MKGLLIAAPSSGAGKTTLTLGILRALNRKGVSLASAKSGPDYIDPQFHKAATGTDCQTLDAWAMSPAQLASIASTDHELLIVEGAMGLFDGAGSDAKGSSADLAETLGLPVVLVVDCKGMSHSIAALVSGFANFRKNVTIAGVILNNTGSPRHVSMLKAALEPSGIPILGAFARDPKLALPSRHLGLKQAVEREDLPAYLDSVAHAVDAQIDLDALQALAQPVPEPKPYAPFPPLGQRIAIAQDVAFAFAYPHLLADWRAAGAELSFFSPLENQAPDPNADAIYLPGGYPELHAGRITAAQTFLNALKAADSATIYGECGGYMLLGEGLIDKDGTRHKMAGLLPLVTSFEHPERHLGYRRLKALNGHHQGQFNAHEFHYSKALREDGPALFDAYDAQGTPLGKSGLCHGRISGSYMHLISPKPH